MKNISFLLSLPVFLGSLGAQTEQKRDSFLDIYKTTTSDTAKVWVLMEAGKLYTERNADSSLLYLQQALDLAERIKFEKGIVRCRINKANANLQPRKYDEAIAPTFHDSTVRQA
ncbi:MAG: hypothetical protein IPN76_35005 [Saprospiraceae bacterium]|nr:hypothetical protein [Saprospiraceae bacterium]